LFQKIGYPDFLSNFILRRYCYDRKFIEMIGSVPIDDKLVVVMLQPLG